MIWHGHQMGKMPCTASKIGLGCFIRFATLFKLRVRELVRMASRRGGERERGGISEGQRGGCGQRGEFSQPTTLS